MPQIAEPEAQPKKGNYRPELAEREMARYDKLKTYRDSVFLSPWQLLSQYFLPNISDINQTKTEGLTGWSDLVYDTTAIEAARTCTTGQSNWATPAAEPWFAWRPPEFLNQEEDDDGAIWCGIATEIALNELARSNYYRISGTQYQSRTVFGTGHMHIEEGKRNLINCMTRKIGTYCIAKDSEDNIDTVYSEFKLSARQAAQEFGIENLGEKIQKALKDGGKRIDEEFNFLHSIRPRDDLERDSERRDSENKPIASIYVCLDDKVCVKVGGYDEMPDSVTRFNDWGTGSVWGYSPAFETLPNVRQLNYIVKFMDAMAELRANPRILAPSGTSGQMDLRPGGITAYDPNNPSAGKPEEWMSQSDLRTTEESAEIKREAVNRMFYSDVFRMLAQIDRKMTAYEVQQRVGEKLEQLSPMFGRLITEKTDPDLRRIFGILFRAGKFPTPPRSMYVPSPDGKSLKLAMPEVTYTSRLALALKSLQNRATVDAMTFMTEFAVNNQRPELLDNFDCDSIVRKYWLNQGASASVIRPMREVVALRASRAKQAAAANAMAMAEQASKAAANLGRAPQTLQDAAAEQMGNVVPMGGAAA